MSSAYVEARDGGYYFVNSRVSLDSMVYEFLRGESAEAIAQAFPSLTLEQVYGGITFYLAHRVEIDAHLQEGEARFADLANESRESNPLLYGKLDAARRSIPSTRR